MSICQSHEDQQVHVRCVSGTDDCEEIGELYRQYKGPAQPIWGIVSNKHLGFDLKLGVELRVQQNVDDSAAAAADSRITGKGPIWQ